MLDFGTYPTPVEWLEPLSSASTALWVKHDDLTNAQYGGSKVRKLGPLFEDAKYRGATRLVTLGAVGSHHVLATGIFGKHAGFSVQAVVMPQPQSCHVLQTARASIGQGVRMIPVTSYREAMREMATCQEQGAYAIPTGGSNRLGTLGLVTAAAELEAQVHAGLLPEPNLIVVALGSGGTAGGLCAGLVRTRLRTRVLAIAVAEPVKVFAERAHVLANELLDPALRRNLAARLEVDRSYLGDGYGFPTPKSVHAAREAARVGLVLDDTYTAKAFAAALDRVALGQKQTVLFWNTLSSASLEPLLANAPEEHELAAEIRQLARS